MAVETAAERRARLVGIARDVIADEGIAACTFRRLAAAAGTSTRPFTHAFGTRDALLREVAMSTWRDSPVDVDAATAAVERPDDWDAIGELVDIGATWLPLSDEQSRAERVYLEIILFCMTRPELQRELLGFSEAANRQMAALVEEAQRRGQIRDDEPAHDLVMAYWAYHAGLVVTGLYEPTELPRDMLLRIWVSGVRALLGTEARAAASAGRASATVARM